MKKEYEKDGIILMKIFYNTKKSSELLRKIKDDENVYVEVYNICNELYCFDAGFLAYIPETHYDKEYKQLYEFYHDDQFGPFTEEVLKNVEENSIETKKIISKILNTEDELIDYLPFIK